MQKSVPVENRILQSLPKSEWERIQPHFQAVKLEFKIILYERYAPVDYAYFPNCGMISVVTFMEEGAGVEVATIGNEGMAGPISPWRPEKALAQFIVQIAGQGLRIPVSQLKVAAELDGALGDSLLRYQGILFRHVAQGAACNAIHSVGQRCCRWLLMTQDRVQSNELPLTHEFLAQMLAVRRSSITDVLLPLQGGGLISYRRGKITIVDREGLKENACECYPLIANVLAGLNGNNGKMK
jgi:CRP-like cAMP-binding protein